MDRYVRARDRVVTQLKQIKLFCDKVDNNTTLEAIQIREENCEKLYKDFNEYEIELLSFEEYEPKKDGVDNTFLNTLAVLRAIKNSRSPEQNTEVQELNVTLGQFIGQQQSFLQGMNQSQNARLPKINIEPFAGDYKLWPSFHDLYVTSVHENNSINAVHKLQILNGLLRGDAASLIRHIKVTAQNYEEAWTKLVERYNKPKAIIFSLIQLFLEQKSCNYPNHRELRRLCDTSDEVIRGLRAVGDLAENRDPWLIHLLVNKLDGDTRQLWAKESVDDAFPSFDKLLKFLTTRCDTLESCVEVKKPTGASPRHVRSFNTTQVSKWKCVACQQDHSLYKCPLFKSMNVDNRKKIIEDSKSCLNCLRSGHLQQQCFSRAVCLICKRKHHSLLHNDQQSTNLHTINENSSTVQPILSPPTSAIVLTSHQTTIEKPLQSTSSVQSTSSAQSTSAVQLSTNHSPTTEITSLHEFQTPLKTILPTALIYIQSSNGKLMQARALLDSGSQSSFISESCMQRLGLRRKYSHISIYGLASCPAGKTRGKTMITVKSRTMQHYTIQLTAHIIEKISSPLPATKISIPTNNEIWQIDLADPKFNIPSTVDLLIGAEFFLDILEERKMNINNLPVLHASKFGWLIAGKFCPEGLDCHDTQNYNVQVNSSITNENLSDLLKKFWQLEEPLIDKQQNIENDPCERIFKETTTRSADGKFIVRLPFVEPRPELGDSFATAKSRLFGIEKRFARSSIYKEDYSKFMQEYIQLEQMKQVSWAKLPHDNNLKYCMPHHAVFKESTTTKLRVVFDASCKTSTGVSLNDCLMTGPKLQPDLTTTLFRFRLNVIAINADIEKMYRQILVDPSDANFQCILWRNHQQEELSPYKCMTVTYGTACAPFLAIRTLEELARIYETKYPDAARVIRNQFYMDDLLTGSASVEEAIVLKTQITEILGSCGYRLRKWKSNSKELLKSVEMDNAEDIPKLIEDDQSTKTLGIMWYPQSDIFTFKINRQPIDTIWTKRKILSESSKLYDPLGWLSPIIISFKMILQKLWLAKTDWDDEAPQNILSMWNKIYNNLNSLQQIKIPRFLIQPSNTTSLQLHAFCDASEAAYGCVIYLRSINNLGNVSCHIVCSKSKVAPIKQISLPRLELCGALLLAELVKYCQPLLNNENANIYAWTDSMVVLHWLSDVPARWKTFIANRTSNILDIIPRSKWNHVSSKENPADFISRGVDPKVIPTLKGWWQGPRWLKLNEAHWPKDKPQTPSKEVNIEDRKKGAVVLTTREDDNIISQLLIKYSSWFKIKKILAYILRFCQLTKTERSKGNLLFSEYVDAEKQIVRTIQSTSFNVEIGKLKNSVTLEAGNVLTSLDPFLDSQGILRVGGRLRNAELSYSVKHPIILPKIHVANQLIIQELHTANLHAGVTLMTNLLRQKYWMIGARNQVKRYIKSCVICIRYRHNHLTQKMADLPPERCIKNRPFTNTGVDYLGPIYVKSSQHRNSSLTKAYVAVFVCLAVKAVHLEVVSSLNTEAFLAALKRFVSRRGIPNKIWCDNGSNFIGANNELKRLKTEIVAQQNTNVISNYILQKGIEFNFNPASAPHFGGLWEAAVKSVKHHFKRTIKEAKLNFEETTTLLTQIESILNSRPLCRITNDITNLDILTPGHFLIGESMSSVPEPLLEDIPVHKLSRWQNIQNRIQSFWKLWSRDYLNTLQERGKWKTGKLTINTNDIVLIKDDNLPPNQWLLGRIIQIHPGRDGIVRVATIKTKANIIKRPVTKLIAVQPHT